MLKRYPSLDGLRGVAVLIVLLAHLTPLYVSGAFGVDVFFVLSGFLITSILGHELRQTHTIHLRNFYIKRFLRLLPALWLTVVLLLLVLLLTGGLHGGHLREAIYAVTYTSNWVSGLRLDYMSYLTHTWSLSIEEQFYLIWPVLLVLGLGVMLKRGGGDQVFFRCGLVCLGLALACAVYRNVLDFSPIRVYRGLDTHFDGLMLGASLACFHLIGGLGRLAKPLHWLAPLALAFILILPVWLGWFHEITIKIGYLLVALAATAVIADLVLSESGWLATILSFRPLRYCGKISYGLYLYHWPIYKILGEGRLSIDNAPARTLLTLALAFLISDLSFRFIEVRFLKLKKKFSPPAPRPAPTMFAAQPAASTATR